MFIGFLVDEYQNKYICKEVGTTLIGTSTLYDVVILLLCSVGVSCTDAVHFMHADSNQIKFDWFPSLAACCQPCESSLSFCGGQIIILV